jgi:putative acetyltransferase
MTEIIIRDYRPDDATALVELFRSSVRVLARKDHTENQLLAWAPDDIDPNVFGPRRASRPTWVAEIDEQIAGFSDLEPDGHVDMLYIHPAHQGKGVARALLQHVEEAAIHDGLKLIYTHASITARPVFERMGFKTMYAQTVTARGETFTNYRMEKPL